MNMTSVVTGGGRAAVGGVQPAGRAGWKQCTVDGVAERRAAEKVAT